MQYMPFSLSTKVPALINIFAISIIPVHYFLYFYLGQAAIYRQAPHECLWQDNSSLYFFY